MCKNISDTKTQNLVLKKGKAPSILEILVEKGIWGNFLSCRNPFEGKFLF